MGRANFERIAMTVADAILENVGNGRSKAELQRAKTQLFPEVILFIRSEIESSVGDALIPEAHETTVVTLENYKTAALFFDRVWATRRMIDRPPDDIRMFGATDEEVWPQAWGALRQVLGTSNPHAEAMLTLARELTLPMPPGSAPRYIATALHKNYGFQPTPMYASNEERDREYRAGDEIALLATIENLGVIDEARLTWDQVQEIRSDAQAKLKLRKLKNWLNQAYDGKTISEVSDAIAIRLEDYKWAIRKHGIYTVTGTISELLDPKLLSATAATATGLTLAGDPFWAALASAGIMVGKVAISVTSKLVDLSDRKRGQDSEVAFVHQLAKLTK